MHYPCSTICHMSSATQKHLAIRWGLVPMPEPEGLQQLTPKQDSSLENLGECRQSDNQSNKNISFQT